MTNECKKKYDLYLAGRMRGKPNLNRPMFVKVAESLRGRGYSVWNPAEHDSYLESSYAECMTMDLNAVINECDGMALLPGWRSSLGANVEVLSAFVCGKKCFEIVSDESYANVELIAITPDELRLPYSLVGRLRKFKN